MEHKKRYTHLSNNQSKKKANQGITSEEYKRRMAFYTKRYEDEQKEKDKDKETNTPEKTTTPKVEKKKTDTPVSKQSSTTSLDKTEDKKVEVLNKQTNDDKAPKQDLKTEETLAKTEKTSPKEENSDTQTNIPEPKGTTETSTTQTTDKEDESSKDIKSGGTAKAPEQDLVGKTTPSPKTSGTTPPKTTKKKDGTATIKSGAKASPDGGGTPRLPGGDQLEKKETSKEELAGDGGKRLIDISNPELYGKEELVIGKMTEEMQTFSDEKKTATKEGLTANEKKTVKTREATKKKQTAGKKSRDARKAKDETDKDKLNDSRKDNIKAQTKTRPKENYREDIGWAQQKLEEDTKKNIPSTKEQLEDEAYMDKFNESTLESLQGFGGTIEGAIGEVRNNHLVQEPSDVGSPEKGTPLRNEAPVQDTPVVDPGAMEVKIDDKDIASIKQTQEDSENIWKAEGIGEGLPLTKEELKQSKHNDLVQASQSDDSIKQNATQGPADIEKATQGHNATMGRSLKDKEQTKRGEMRKNRDEQLKASRGLQDRAKSQYEIERAKLTAEMDAVYTRTRDAVNKKLEDLDTEVKLRFKRVKDKAIKAFSENVNTRLSKFHNDRYLNSGWNLIPGVLVVNLLRYAFEDTSNIPEVIAIFEDERKKFISTIDREIKHILSYVNREVTACKALIAQAHKDLEKIVAKQGPAFKKVAEKAYADISKKLQQLDQRVNKKAAELKKYLKEARNKAITEVDEKIAEIKERLKGLLHNLAKFLVDAAYKFFKWVLSSSGFSTEQIDQIINQGKQVLTKIVTDPMGFFQNVAEAIGLGFNNFVGNIGKHLKNGFFAWLTGAMTGVGLNLPKKWDLKGIFSVVLQVMGLNWDGIRARIAKEVGEDNLARAEEAGGAGLELLQQIKEKGFVEAVWDMLVEKAGEIQAMVITEIQNWLITSVVKQAIVKILSMLNPAGAIVQAILAIYDFAMWLINNWERIVQIIQNIVSSIGKIAMGQLGDAAKFIENTLATFVPMLLDFLARLLRLGNVSEKIKKILQRVRKPIDDLLAKIMRFIKNKIKGFGKKGNKNQPKKRQSETDPRTHKEKQKAVKKAAKEAQKIVDDDKIPMKHVQEKLKKIKIVHSLKSLDLKLVKTKDNIETYRIIAEINPKETEKADREKNLSRPILEKNTTIKHSRGNSRAFPLTSRRSGNSNTVDIPGWDHASKLNAAFGKDKNGGVGRKGVWVKGHIIHHDLGGNGANKKNLFIIDKTANDAMESVESQAVSMLESLISLTDPTDSRYDKVMFYEVSYNRHAWTLPLKAFAKSMTITYGTIGLNGKSKKAQPKVKITSSKPSKNADEVSVNINSLGTLNIASFLGKKGLKGNYPRYLAVILRKESYETKDELQEALLDEDYIDEYNKSQTRGHRISSKLVKSRTNKLMKILDSDLNFTL